MRITRFLLAFLVVLLYCLDAPSALAQDAGKDIIAMHYDVKVKPGMADAFESAVQRHLQWRVDHDDPWTWEIYQISIGPRMGDYAFRSNNHGWADIDAYEAWEGPANMHFMATVMPYIESASSNIDVIDPAVMRMPEDMNGYELFRVDLYHLKPGKEMLFEETVKKIHGAIVEHDYLDHYVLMYSAAGGPNNVAAFVSPHQSWASMQGPEQSFGAFIVEAFGPEEAGKLFEAFGSTYTASESMVVRLRTDLMPTPTMASGME